MKKIPPLIFLLWFTFQSNAQENDVDASFDFYMNALFEARAAADLPTAFQYLDSIILLGEEFEWNAKIIRVDLYRFIEDSLIVANQIIDECIQHYQMHPNEELLIEAYDLKLFVTESRRDITVSIQTIHDAISVAESVNDSSGLAFFEKCLGFFYLHNLSDTTNALKHLNKALHIAIENEEWMLASLITGELIDYYLFVQHIPKAREYANLCVVYAYRMDSSDIDHYNGHIDRGEFFLAIKAYKKAIQDGSIVFKKGIELKDYDMVEWGAYLLTEAYWKTGNIDSAYHFAQIALDRLEGEGGAYELKTQYYWSSKIYAAKGMYKEALELLEQFYAFEKKDYEKLEVKAIARTLYQGELEKKELEKSKIALSLLLAEEKSSFKSIIIFSILILFIVVIIYSFLLHKKRQKAIQMNKILAASNEVVLKQKELLVKNIETLKKDLKDKLPKDQGVFHFSQSAVQINFSDIIYLESSNNYVLIHVIDRKTPLLERVKMIELIKHFPSDDFIKTHRSYYVNRKHIIARPSKYKFKMSNNTLLNASRGYVDNLDGALVV